MFSNFDKCRTFTILKIFDGSYSIFLKTIFKLNEYKDMNRTEMLTQENYFLYYCCNTWKRMMARTVRLSISNQV